MADATTLQAILDASDSSSDDGDDENNNPAAAVVGGDYFYDAVALSNSSSNHHNHSKYYSSSALEVTATSSSDLIDLEQILREEEEDDDEDGDVEDDDEDDDHDLDLESSYVYSPSRASNVSGFTGGSYGSSGYPLRTTTTTAVNGSTQQQTTGRSSYTPSVTTVLTEKSDAHNEEEWAVLQAILREDDDEDEGDDDDDDDDDDIRNMSSSEKPPAAASLLGFSAGLTASLQGDSSFLYNHSASGEMTTRSPLSNPDVEHLLAVSSEHDDDDDDASSPQDMRALMLRHGSTLESSSSAELPPPPSSTLSPRVSSSSARSGTFRSTAATVDAASLELSDEEASRMAVEQAHAYERRLLKAGHRDIVSPLMVKRRLKPKITLAKRETASPAAPPPRPTTQRAASGGGMRFHTSGLIEDKALADISASISKHAAVDARVKCGLPTCLAFNSRFIAVGTQLGIVLVFDLFGALRQRLGASYHNNHNADNAGDDNAFQMDSGVRMMGSITSLDLNYNGECCAVGYKSGLIVLWDTIRGTVLRSVEDLHPSPMLSVRFYGSNGHDLKLISADAGGLVNKATFTKNLLWSTYSMDAECLLDGTAGQILAVNILEPYILSAAYLGQASNGSGGGASSSASSSSSLANNSSLSPLLTRTLKSISLIALSSERSSFAVAVEPTVSVLHRWSRPPVERVVPLDGGGEQAVDEAAAAIYLPCLAWGWALTMGSGNVALPMLARSWGCCVQLLVSSFPTLEETEQEVGSSSHHHHNDEAVHWPAFGVHQEFDAEAPVVALEWLSERTLVYLTMTNELTVVDTVVMTLLERVDFSDRRVVFAEFALSRMATTTTPAQSFDEDEVTHDASSSEPAPAPKPLQPIACTSFQNSVRCSDQRFMVLCQDELRQISMMGARQRISGLEADGEWLEALALALDHYEGAFTSLEDRQRSGMKQNRGVNALERHPEFNSGARGEEEEWIAKLLLRYLTLAVDNAPQNTGAMAGDNMLSVGNGRARINLAQSHFQMLAGVCVEYCVTTKRLDLLFGPIFRRFRSVGYTAVFLDVLEPYVLNDRLSYIAAEVMSHFVDHVQNAGSGVATVERCLLHMDCTMMDFDSIIALLRKHDMYSALCFVFNQGLKDFVSPLSLLLERVFDEADTGNAMLLQRQTAESSSSTTRLRGSQRGGGTKQSDFDRFGYKALLYLQFSFQGKSFPKEEPILPEERQASVKPELLQFLTRASYTAPDHARRKGKSSATLLGHRSYNYPYMRLLMQVDPVVLLEAISEAMTGRQIEQQQEQQSGGDSSSKYPKEQHVVDLLTSLILPETMSEKQKKKHLSQNQDPMMPLFKSRQATSAFLDFTAQYITRALVRVPKSLTFLICQRIAHRFANAAANNDETRRAAAQVQIMELLSALPRESYEPDKVLELIEKAGIHRAALLLHQQVAAASSWQDEDGEDEDEENLKLRAHHFCSAIDCFVDDDDAEFRLEVFEYIRKECTNAAALSNSKGPQQFLAKTVYSRLRPLVRLDALWTARLVAELFVEDFDVVVEALNDEGGEAQYLFLESILSGELMEVDPVAGSVLSNPSMDHHLKYLSLMAKLYPDKVYVYLSTHDNYRAQDALKLCEEYQIADASAYLLERMGNISSALQLILQTLESRLMGLKRTLRGMEAELLNQNYNPSPYQLSLSTSTSRDRQDGEPSKHEQEADGVKRILVVALDLCERNSGSSFHHHYHSTHAPMASSPSASGAAIEAHAGSQLWFNVLDRLINAKGFLRLANEQKEHAAVMERVLNDLLRLTMQRMVSNVPLLDLVHKVTADHSASRLGELREMMSSLLGTYGFELNLFAKAADVFHQDIADLHAEESALVQKAAFVGSAPPKQEALAQPAAANGTTSAPPVVVVDPSAGQASASSKAGGGSFKHTMQRLRGRRDRQQQLLASPSPHRPSDAAAAATITDQNFYRRTLEPVVYNHAVGQLGDAHHRGRLITAFVE